MRITTDMMPKRTAMILLMLTPAAACAKPVDQATPRTPAIAADAVGATLPAFIKRHESKLLTGDIDGDGKVSRAEFIAAARSGKGDPAKRFARLDSNGDGMLDKSEIDAMLTRRFTRLDTNGDGRADTGERAAARVRKGKASGDGSGS